MGKRIKDISIGQQLTFSPEYRLLVDRMDTGSGDWLQAKNMELKVLGNTYFQGSINNINYHDIITSSDTFIRYSTNGGTNWKVLATKHVQEDTNLYFTEARVLATTGVQDAVDNMHTHTNKTLLDNLIDSGAGNAFLSDDGTYSENIYRGKIDVDASPDFIGALSSDGLIRVDSTLDYTDGGDYITIGLEATLKSNYDSAYTDTQTLQGITGALTSDGAGNFSQADSTDLGDSDTLKRIDTFYGEMYEYENTSLTTIGTQDVYHAVNYFTTGSVNGFSFTAGIEGSIASVADYSGTVAGTVLITDVAHGLITGDIITIHVTTDYNGTYSITKVTDDTFYITATYTSSQTGEWAMGSYLECLTGSDGTYHISMSNTSFAATANTRFRFALNKNITPLNNVSASRTYGTTDYGSLSTQGLVSLVADDRIWLSVVNQTSATDITIRHANITIIRI